MPRLAALLLLSLAAPALAGPRITSHDIVVDLQPGAASLEARDEMTVLRDGGGPLEFRLNAGLEVLGARLDGREASGLERVGEDGRDALWRVEVTPGPGSHGTFVLHYRGVVADSARNGSPLGADASRGALGPDGAYLPARAAWYPADGGLAAYSIRASIPAPFTVVTQGALLERTDTPPLRRSSWRSSAPTDGLTLVAGRWRHAAKVAGDVTLGVYLSEQNGAAAERLLDAAARRLAACQRLLGPYPHPRFDIVESAFGTGLGPPGYALLGRAEVATLSADARGGGLPPDALDHELVRGWWGHSVLPAPASGDWSEGLTAYCARHLAHEHESAGAARTYRERTNVAFSLRVPSGNAPAIRTFEPSGDARSDDVGSGKCRMLFHMLRREIGDEAFWATLRRVAAERAGTRVSWDVWQAEFEKSSKRNLGSFFRQWLDRGGAPLLALEDVRLDTQGGRMRVTGRLAQQLAEDEEPWRLSVPVVVELLSGREELLVDLSADSTQFSVLVPSLPLRVKADPDHHLLRRLAADELPACLAATLEQRPLVVYPDGDTLLRAAAELAARAGATVVKASEAPAAPPPGRSLLVFGDAARVPLLAALRQDLPDHFATGRDGADVTILATARHPADETQFVTTFVGNAAALAARARAAYDHPFDGRVVFVADGARERRPVPARLRTERYVLPDLRRAEDARRVEKTLAELVAPGVEGRLAGTAAEKEVRDLIASRMRIAGLDVRQLPFGFDVRTSAEGACLTRAGSDVAGCHPLVASPLTPEGGLTLRGVAEHDAADVTGAGVLLDIPAGTQAPLEFVRDAAALAAARGAAALLLRLPAEPPVRVAELWETPETLHADVRESLATRAARGGASDPLVRAARTAARIGSDERLPLPVVAVPHSFTPSDEAHVARVAFRAHRVESANVIARLRPEERTRRGGGAILVGAHVDHLGPGFPGADDNASGVVAVLEAANVLSVHQDLLGREVLFVFFGAQEWGLRGSRAFVRNLRPETRPLVCINADTVGRRGVPAVDVVGVSHHPRLARLVAAALGRASLAVGQDIDRFAFRHGGDHWPFHAAGVPAVTLWSGDEGSLHTQRDTLDRVSAAKVTRVARALALSALAASIGY